ncbi:Signal transduction response regulator, receiver domain histidine kinase, Hpt-like [Desulfonema limicola]|uniref:Sensory/regulatory protein RpfC n=1 Tax=Desulfonema limicola TaxID=45656 RepID=A0A975BCG8_9BACT|nr:response regulator [Desulfonema limicola]QTA82836.1 Signal transduction response regulator, receiver domain histidine kinase, Hpt-like [Desulfonema limicola]
MNTQQLSSSSSNIIIVDDNPDNLRLLAGLLGQKGYNVRLIRDGKMVLASAKSAKPDLILLDILMPEINGYEVCRQLKQDKDTSDIPVIFISALNEVVDKVKAFSSGGVDYITKPFHQEEVFARIEAHLSLRKLQKDIAEKNTCLLETQEKLIKAKAEAEQAARVKSQFLANMSHEIRTPLNSIIGLSHLALQTGLTPKQQDYLVKIQTSSYSLLGIINDLLDFSKIEAGKMDIESVDFNLEDVLENLSTLLSIKAQSRGLELIFKTAENVPLFLTGDPLRLGQILINLTDNAIKFTEKGEIMVSTELMAETGSSQVILKFTIHDTGIGLTQEQIKKLFHAFTQADGSITRRYGGTGLGLVICRHLAELMGGEISASSIPGRGSSFSFTAQFKRQPYHKERALVPKYDLRGIRVLIADDNETSLNILKEYLESFTFKVTTALSAKQALAILENAPADKPFELVLMDWKMPGMDGMEATKHIKENKKLAHIPFVLMITAYGREEIVSQAKNAGVDAFLIKPVNQSVLFDTIMEGLGQNISCKELIQPLETKSIQDLEKIQGASVLLVEDNIINQQVAKELLEHAGMAVTIACNGIQALQILDNMSFDLVLMDIQMPEMDGIQAVKIIRQQPRFDLLPVVAMTAHALTGDREKFIKKGMNEHLSKPINPEKLFAALIKWIKPGKRELPHIVLENNKNHIDNFPKHLPGIDIKAGLRNVAENQKMFRKILIQFQENFADTADQMRDIISKGELEKGERLIHNLKGVSGNIGAVDLFLITELFEHALKCCSADNFKGMAEKLDKEIKQVLKSADILKNLVPEENRKPVTGEKSDPAIIQSCLCQLNTLLNDNDLIEEELMDLLYNYPGNPDYKKYIKDLESCIEIFDYENAVKTLAVIADLLNISLDMKENNE